MKYIKNDVLVTTFKVFHYTNINFIILLYYIISNKNIPCSIKGYTTLKHDKKDIFLVSDPSYYLLLTLKFCSFHACDNLHT